MVHLIEWTIPDEDPPQPADLSPDLIVASLERNRDILTTLERSRILYTTVYAAILSGVFSGVQADFIQSVDLQLGIGLSVPTIGTGILVILGLFGLALVVKSVIMHAYFASYNELLRQRSGLGEVLPPLMSRSRSRTIQRLAIILSEGLIFYGFYSLVLFFLIPAFLKLWTNSQTIAWTGGIITIVTLFILGLVLRDLRDSVRNRFSDPNESD